MIEAVRFVYVQYLLLCERTSRKIGQNGVSVSVSQIERRSSRPSGNGLVHYSSHTLHCLNGQQLRPLRSTQPSNNRPQPATSHPCGKTPWPPPLPTPYEYLHQSSHFAPKPRSVQQPADTKVTSFRIIGHCVLYQLCQSQPFLHLDPASPSPAKRTPDTIRVNAFHPPSRRLPHWGNIQGATSTRSQL